MLTAQRELPTRLADEDNFFVARGSGSMPLMLVEFSQKVAPCSVIDYSCYLDGFYVIYMLLLDKKKHTQEPDEVIVTSDTLSDKYDM